MKRKLDDTNMAEGNDKQNNDSTSSSTFEIIGKKTGWTQVEDGELKGMKTGKDPMTGQVVALSFRQCPEANRWTVMPSLTMFEATVELDLHKCRYMRQLHPSVCQLINLETLILTRCEKLTSLPEEIGMLKNLVEVCSGEARFCLTRKNHS